MDISNILQYDKDTYTPLKADGTQSLMDVNTKKRFSGNDVCSARATSEQKKRAQNTDVKLWRLIMGINGYGDLDISLSTIPNGGYAEVINKNTGTATIATVIQTTPKGSIKPLMEFSACELSVQNVGTDYNLTRRGTALLAAHLAWGYENDMEIKQILDAMKSLIIEDPDSTQWNDPAYCEKVGSLLCKLSSNVYYAYKNDYDMGNNIKRLRDSDIQNMRVLKTSYGNIKKVKKSNKMIAEKGMFNLNPKRSLSDEEKKLIPDIPSTFKWEDWHFTMAKDIQESSIFSEPFRVVMLGGPSGTGKSQGSAAIAYLLGRPRLIFTCDPDTDEFKLVGSTMPNTSGGNTSQTMDLDTVCKMKDLPTFEDITFDFSNAYEKLFGKKPDDLAMEADCYKELFIRLNNNSDFMFVKSNIIKALENGYIVEIQEPTVIKRSSVLVALNAMLECSNDSAMITLPTGETIKRHPEAVVIYTTNANYSGCQSIQQSVLSRIDIIREIDNPEKSVLVARAMSNTGCDDKKALEKMADVFQEINEYCKNQDISDGVCGPREFQNWIKKAMLAEMRINGAPKKNLSTESICSAAFSTILSHVSQVSEDREDVLTAVINKKFDHSLVQSGRILYESGVA